MKEASGSRVSPDGRSYPALEPNTFPRLCLPAKSPKIRITFASTSACPQPAGGVITILPLVSSYLLMSAIGRSCTHRLNALRVNVSVEINAVSAILNAPDFIASEPNRLDSQPIPSFDHLFFYHSSHLFGKRQNGETPPT